MSILKMVKFGLVFSLLLLLTTSSFADDVNQLYEKLLLSKPPERIEAHDFQLKDLNGNSVSLSDFRGKIVLLNFWASWCGPCVAEIPDLQKLQQQFKDDDFVVLTVNAGENKEKVKEFLEKNNFELKVLLDNDKKVFILYQTFSLPTTYLLDRKGYFLAGALGLRNWNSPDFHKLLKSVINADNKTPAE